ncbi:MAG TPA: DUF2917 domain-containing protein [Paucimonas sp.]|nr:DUF2917 domain-containing protein [Paucimonas sp.]
MRDLFTNSARIVEAGAARSGIASRPQTLQIVSGSAWVTIEGETHDYWLSTGDALDVCPGRLVVVEADREDVALKLGMRRRFGLPGALGHLFQYARNALRRALRRPIAGCASAVNTIGVCASGSALSGSGWRRLGHL